MTSSQDHTSTQISDAPCNNWVDKLGDRPLANYLRLARMDRPIGIWLLLWPCWWSLLLAGGSGSLLKDLWLMLLFGIGASVMRAAGCIYNDILDRHYDARVARTRNRPLASGQIKLRHAVVFLLFCCLTGLAVLINFNLFSILLGISSLGIVAVYPLMKRITYWPQAVLGLAFAWGALMGWASLKGSLEAAPLALYAATVFWIIGYDTIYAHQDKEDDALIGLKSTALRFGENTRLWLFFFYTMTIFFMGLAGVLAQLHLIFYFGLALSGGHLLWQILTLRIDNPENCLSRFRSNREFGALVFLSFLGSYLLG